MVSTVSTLKMVGLILVNVTVLTTVVMIIVHTMMKD